MKFGIGIANYGETLSVERMRSVAVEAERLHFESIWTTDHILMPRQSGTPYERIFDSIASLAYLASVTQEPKLGISALIIAMRNPIVAVKQLSSIDEFAGGGRLILAMAAGWNEKEFSFLGGEYHRRGKRLNESIRLFRDLWRGHTSFHSEIIKANFDDAVFQPRPATGQIPIWIGGTSQAAMKRAADLGDGWHPNVLPMNTFKKLVEQFRQVSPNAKNKDICVRIGLNTKASNSEYVGPTGERRILLSGNMLENHGIVEELEKLGVSTAIVVPSPDGKISTEGQIQSIRTFAQEFL